MNPTAPVRTPTSGDDHNPHLIGLASLLRLSLSGADMAPLGQQLLARAHARPDDANTLLDLSTILQFTGNRELALAMQTQALAMQQVYRLPPASSTASIRLLAIKAPGDLMANTPLECLLEGSDIELTLLYLGPGMPFPTSVPNHDVLMVAVAESDENRPLLQQIQQYLRDWPRPVLNLPEQITRVSRDSACELMKTVPGTVMPRATRIDRQAMERIAQGAPSIGAFPDGGAFPIIVRPVGSHAGRGLIKLDRPQAIPDYLKTMPEREFYISRFIDYRGRDGMFRKYRIALIDGQPFVCHMAISDHWIVHYLSAGMAESAEKRAEEARFMAQFDDGFARRHALALRTLNDRMGLDYLAIDCAETPEGNLLIFEIDNAMIVHAMDPVDIFPYKQAQMHKVFSAFRRMLVDAVQRAQ